MKKGSIWFKMLAKRQLKKKSIYFVMAVLVISCFCVKYAADNFEVAIEIGVVNEDNGNISEMIEKNLYEHRGMIVFKKFTTYEELAKNVRAGNIMGGYVLKQDFSSNILAGNRDGIIEVLSTPNSIVTSAANEIFFSFVMKEISYEELVKDTINTELFHGFSEQEFREDLRKYYDVNLSDGSTFSVDYNKDLSEYDGKTVSIDTYDYISPIVTGLVGLMVFISGMCGTINYYDDRKNGSLALLTMKKKQMVAVMEIAIPVFITTITGVIILLVTDMETGIWQLNKKYLLYSAIVIAYCYLQKTLIRKKEIYVSLIPAFILLSIILCPVFLNISAIAPGIACFGKWLPLYWLYIL